MNRAIKLLTFSDVFVLTGFGLVQPILAIFINEEISGGSIFTAGIASAIFLIAKSIIQLPFSRYVDIHDNKRRWLIFGTFLIISVPFIYLFAKDIKVVYIAETIHGIGSGLAYPTWIGLWNMYLNKKHQSFEWSFYSTVTGISVAASAAIGGAVSQFFGFTYTFILVAIMYAFGCGILFKLDKKEKKESWFSFFGK